MFAKPSNGEIDYSPPAVVLIAETLKLLVSIGIFIYQTRGIRRVLKYVQKLSLRLRKL